MNKGTKRAREEEDADVEKEDFLVQQLLKADPEKLARAGQHGERILSELSNFIEKLRASKESVKKARTDEQKADQQARAKEIKAQMEERKLKMIAAGQCSECKKCYDNLLPCVAFKDDSNAGNAGDGVLVCRDCLEKVCAATCAECNTFLCTKSCWCCDPSYKCRRCENIVCLLCAEKDGYAGSTCDCDDWFCADCADVSIKNEQCCPCSEFRTYCCNCDGKDLIPRCEGECDRPLCDDCVCTLACGNDARLCGHCDYICDDCDMCSGIYPGSRWKNLTLSDQSSG